MDTEFMFPETIYRYTPSSTSKFFIYYLPQPIYPNIQNLFVPPHQNSSVTNWKKDFYTPNLTEDLLEGYSHINKCTTSEVWKETRYKIMHGVYCTHLHSRDEKLSKPHTPKCPQCQQKKIYLNALHVDLWTNRKILMQHYEIYRRNN